MRIRFITFDHHGAVDVATLAKISHECNVQINFIGLSFPIINFVSQYVYSIELMESSDVDLLADMLEAINP